MEQTKEEILDELEAIKDELYDLLMAGKRITLKQTQRDREDTLLLRKKELEERLEE